MNEGAQGCLVQVPKPDEIQGYVSESVKADLHICWKVNICLKQHGDMI